MFCAKCGTRIPPGKNECPSCGWTKTVEHTALKCQVNPQSTPQDVIAEQIEVRRIKSSSVWGFITIGSIVIILCLTGSYMLFNYRGIAWNVWSKNISSEVKEKNVSPIMHIRDELLLISSEISRVEKGIPVNPAGIKKRLDTIEKELEQLKNDPYYFKVFALYKSVMFQLEISGMGTQTFQIPPLPYSTFTIQPTNEYTEKDVSPAELIGEKIHSVSKNTFVRYGPALFGFQQPRSIFKSLFEVDAPKGYSYVEVIVYVEGKVELVEYTARMLDSYRRAYPPFLEGEKEARKRKLPYGHFMWRDVFKIERNSKIYLHRIFMIPSDSISTLILEIRRQGASKMLWVKY